VNEKILRAFTRHDVPATGFVIEQNVRALGVPTATKILKQWTRPGFDLGNHLYSHADVNNLSVDQIEQEITRGEVSIASLLMVVHRKPEFLRFPYNHTGDTKEKHDLIAAFLSAHDYRLAPCTIDTSDYQFNTAYVLATLSHDRETAAKIRGDYITYSGAEIDWYAALDTQVFGYEPPEVMLLHDSPLNGDSIEQVLALFQRRGYRFVSLQQATSDPAYSVPETYVTKYGMMWGYRWAKELHVKVNGQNEPDPPAWIERYVKEHQAH
jgi:peptidoglycan/xylan/chitin deacetylase (PgdA/CDA1 family)